VPGRGETIAFYSAKTEWTVKKLLNGANTRTERFGERTNDKKKRKTLTRAIGPGIGKRNKKVQPVDRGRVLIGTKKVATRRN